MQPGPLKHAGPQYRTLFPLSPSPGEMDSPTAQCNDHQIKIPQPLRGP